MGVLINKGVIEKLAPDFLGDDFKAVQPYPIYRINQIGYRLYVKVFDDNSWLCGVGTTSLLKNTMPESFFLNDWKSKMSSQYGMHYTGWYLEHSANYGTFYHVICGKLLRNEKININKDSFFDYMELFYKKNDYDFNEGIKWYRHAKKNYKKDILSFVKWVQEYKIKPIAMEYQFVTVCNISKDDNPKIVSYSGTFDLVCKATINGVQEVILVDFKTSKGFYGSHEAQLHLYARAWNNEDIHNVVSGLKVEKVYNFAPKDWRKEPSFLFKDQTKSKQKNNIDSYLEIYHNSNKIELKRDEIKDCDISIELDMKDIIVETDPIAEILDDIKDCDITEGINGVKNKEQK